MHKTWLKRNVSCNFRNGKEMSFMDVLIVEPEKAPRMANITGDLNS
jgi:hypothetical protein